MIEPTRLSHLFGEAMFAGRYDSCKSISFALIAPVANSQY